jgi:hypothetical protein
MFGIQRDKNSFLANISSCDIPVRGLDPHLCETHGSKVIHQSCIEASINQGWGGNGLAQHRKSDKRRKLHGFGCDEPAAEMNV